MNLPDAPIASEGFFVTRFFTVRDQEKSKDFYVRILGGKVISPEVPATSNWPMPGSFSTLVVARLPTTRRSSSKPLLISTERMASLTCASQTSGHATSSGATKERSSLPSR